MLWTDAAGVLAAVACAIVLLVLVRAAAQRADAGTGRRIRAFAVFVAACGVIHGLGVLGSWLPAGRAPAPALLAAGLASVAAAIALWRARPEAPAEALRPDPALATPGRRA